MCTDQWTKTIYDSGHTLKHPKKDWKSIAYAVDNYEEMQKLLTIEGTFFYIAKYYKQSNHPGTGLDNQHTMSGRVV